jgi:hypothetical protein
VRRQAVAAARRRGGWLPAANPRGSRQGNAMAGRQGHSLAGRAAAAALTGARVNEVVSIEVGIQGAAPGCCPHPVLSLLCLLILPCIAGKLLEGVGEGQDHIRGIVDATSGGSLWPAGGRGWGAGLGCWLLGRWCSTAARGRPCCCALGGGWWLGAVGQRNANQLLLLGVIRQQATPGGGGCQRINAVPAAHVDAPGVANLRQHRGDAKQSGRVVMDGQKWGSRLAAAWAGGVYQQPRR